MLEMASECGPAQLPSLAIECVYAHYIEAGVRIQATPWQKQVWLARQRPLRGSAEFCNAARRKDRQMTRRVAGMCVYAWRGIDHAPNSLQESSLTLITSHDDRVDECARDFAQDCAKASSPSCAVKEQARPPYTATVPMFSPITTLWLQLYLDVMTLPPRRNIVIGQGSMRPDHFLDGNGDPFGGLTEICRIVRAAADAHLIMSVHPWSMIADPLVSSNADRIVIIVGPRSAPERTQLSRHVSCMLDVDEETLDTFVASLPDNSQIILERRPGCSRDQPFHRTNTLILVKAAFVP